MDKTEQKRLWRNDVIFIAALLAVGMLVQLFRPYKESGRLTQTVKIK